MMAPAEVINLVRARFANIKQYSDALGGVQHAGLRGRFREILAESLLLPYLPPTIEVLTGTIIGWDGQERKARNEDDLVLFDQTWAPLLLRTRGRDALIPITGVRAHIEVKSVLRLSDLDDSLNAAKELIGISPSPAPIGLIFAFASDIGGNHRLPALLQERSDRIGYRPVSEQTTCPLQCVCILGRGCWFLMENKELKKSAGWYEVKPEEDRELLAFVCILSNTMFDNRRGLGTHVLDPTWLVGPNPAMPVTVQ